MVCCGPMVDLRGMVSLSRPDHVRSEVICQSADQWTLGGFKPANNELGSSVRQSAQDPMNTHSFFFSFDSVLPGEASKPASGGLPSWGRPSLQKTLAVPVFIVQNDRAWS